jgi:hypothetical protein
MLTFYGTVKRRWLAEEKILKVYCNIIVPSSLGFSKRSLSFMFPFKNAVCTFPLLYKCRLRHTSHFFYFITQLISLLITQTVKQFIMHFFQYLVT